MSAHNDNREIYEIRLTPAQRQAAAMKKYRAANRFELNEKAKIYRAQRAATDPEFAEMIRAQVRASHAKRRAENRKGALGLPVRAYVRTERAGGAEF